MSIVIENLGYATALALHYLSVEPLSIYDLAGKMGNSHSGSSKHIRVLMKRGLVQVVGKRSETGMGCPAKVFAAKAKHPKPDDDRAGINGIDKSRFVDLKRVLIGCSMTAEEIAEELEITVENARTRLRYWMSEAPDGKHFRIASWRLKEAGRRIYIPVYTFGDGPDAKKPKQGNAEAVKRYREKKRLIVARQQVAARAREHAVRVSPFDQLLMATGTREKIMLDVLEAA